MALRNLKINYYGLLGFLGFLGFDNPLYFLFFLSFLFFLVPQWKGGIYGATSKMAEAMQERTEEKESRKQKIMDLISQNGRVANDEVEKMLGVSNASVERYLDELEKEGKARQVGKTGKSVFYSKI